MATFRAGRTRPYHRSFLRQPAYAHIQKAADTGPQRKDQKGPSECRQSNHIISSRFALEQNLEFCKKFRWFQLFQTHLAGYKASIDHVEPSPYNFLLFPHTETYPLEIVSTNYSILTAQTQTSPE